MIVRCRPLQRQCNNVWQRYVHIKLIHGPHGFPTRRAWHGLHARSNASHQEPVDLFSTSSQKITFLNVAGTAAELVADQLMEAGAMSAGYIPDPPASSVRHLIHDEVLHMSLSRDDRALAMDPSSSNLSACTGWRNSGTLMRRSRRYTGTQGQCGTDAACMAFSEHRLTCRACRSSCRA